MVCINLYNDDCMKIMGDFEKDYFNLVLVDIPYDYVNFKSNGLRNLDKGKADKINFNLEEFSFQLNRICKGSFYIFCSPIQFSTLFSIFKMDFDLSCRTCILEKSNPSPMNGKHIWLSGVELCLYAKKPNATFNQNCKNTVWKYPVSRNKLHPTEKPLKLMEYIIESSTNVGDKVLDCCMGSGTTGVACKNTGRDFYGIELDKDYFEIAKNRL